MPKTEEYDCGKPYDKTLYNLPIRCNRRERTITIFQKLLLYITILFSSSHILAGCVQASSEILYSANDINSDSETSKSQDYHDRTEQVKLRSTYKNLPVNEVQEMSHVKMRKQMEWGFYGHSTIKHDYVLKVIHNEKVVIDHASNLMWHQSGSTNGMNWENAHRWIERLNTKGYAGYHDWRLPTVEEATSLLEPSKAHFFLSHDADAAEYHKLLRSDHLKQKSKSPLFLKDKRGRFFDPVFDKTQGWIWTGDNYQRLNAAWRVDYFSGLVDWDVYYYIFYFVRPVRTLR